MFLLFLYNHQSFSYIQFLLSASLYECLVWEVKLNVSLSVIAFVSIVITIWNIFTLSMSFFLKIELR